MATYKERSVAYKGGGLSFSDFSKGLYLLDTPRSINEQLGSLAMTGGRNCWAEKGALVSQHGYQIRATLPKDTILSGFTKCNAGDTSMFIVAGTGEVYFYTAREGLKKYKTNIETATGVNPTDIILTRKNRDMFFVMGSQSYMYGSFYEDESVSPVEICSGINFASSGSIAEADIPNEFIDYFWVDKEFAVGTNNVQVTVLSITQKPDQTTFHVRFTLADSEQVITSPATISEKTIRPFDTVYYPENIEPTVPTEPTTPTQATEATDPTTPTTPEPTAPTEPTHETITPELIAVANNRLFLVDRSGYIYYSQVGVLDAFEETLGAGKFGGFYDDTSKILSIEDFMDGVLLCKENGIYYCTISNTELTVKKISQAAQKYASDHVIVGEKVYAYDCNTGSIINAVAVNVFGAMVSGKPVVTSDYLDAENSGINASKRWLTYNAESEVFILYYGENLNRGLVITNVGTLFPREIAPAIAGFTGFNQGVVFITDEGAIAQDFKKGTMIPRMSCVAVFEPIALRGNRKLCSTLMEITELNGISYNLSTRNAGSSFQAIKPSFNLAEGDKKYLAPLLYSESRYLNESFSMESKWARKESNVSRTAQPMSGNEGISISLEFPADTAFCLANISLPDFSMGE